jgi:ubiquinone/menaquinone biosynthesis C-methylase UbiE
MAEAAQLRADDRVVDIGCGAGAAARLAARHAGQVTGVDPDPMMLHFARWLAAGRRVTWLGGRAEALPLADHSATVAWALSSAHHWHDRTAGFLEIHRVLAQGGRALLGERLVPPGARGHARHGVTQAQAAELARQLTAIGMSGVRTDLVRAGRRRLVIVSGTRD